MQCIVCLPCRAVGILKESAITDHINLLVSSDDLSQSDFRRLSTSLADIASQPFPVPPIASSTPTHLPDPTTATMRASVLSDVTTASTVTTVTKTDVLTQRNSSSSELTNITTTDISSHGEEGEEEEEGEGDRGPGAGMRDSGYSPGLESMKTEGPVALSDVVVSVPSQTALDTPPTTTTAPLIVNGLTDSDDDSAPPPLPISLPPGELDELGRDRAPSLPSSPPPPIPTSPMPGDGG